MRRISPSMGIALLALFVSLGGTAAAAKHYLITNTHQIKPSVIRSLRGEVGAAGATGPTGPAGPQGPAGPSNLSGLTIVPGESKSVTDGTVGQSVATCPPGLHVVSGGGYGGIEGIGVSKMSEDHQSWYIIVANSTGITTHLEATAYCAGAGQAVAARSNSIAHARAVHEAAHIAAQFAQQLKASKASTVPAATSAQPTATAAKSCSRDTPAVIGGQHKCLGAGEYCATRYERQYERYGFVCSTRYDPPRLRRK